MREGWVLASLDDACNVDYGTRIVQSKSGGTIYPVYGGGGETFRTDTFNRKDCIVIARFAMSKTCVRFVPGEFFLNDSGLSVSAKEGIYQGYLEKYMFYLNDEIYNLGKGAAQRNLDVKQFRKLPVKYPVSLELQQSIVYELDLINELIAKKKAQLKDLDSLAQSLFYDFFGDPVENEKGWEVKKFNEIFKLKSGDSLSAKQFLPGNYPVYGGNGISGYHNAYNMSGEYIIVGRVGVYCGNVRYVTGDFWLTDNAFRLIYDNKELNYHFLCRLLNHLNLHQYANAAAQPVISNSTLKDIRVPLPPLSLQQAFASRIEAIEEEKQKIQSSLKDLETLLASRMQYWFD